MEDIFQQLITNGGPVGVLSAAVVYLIVFLQRKNTSTKRNDEADELRSQINDLQNELTKAETEKELMKKDISYLMTENSGIKEDIKEMKATMNQMAMSIERIAAVLENLSNKDK